MTDESVSNLPQSVVTNPKSRGFTLKPLRGVPSESGFYGYSGKPLSNADRAALEAKGVIFKPHPDGDLMPDGVRLKHPKFRSDYRKRGQDMRTAMYSEGSLAQLVEFDQQFAEWHAEYEKDTSEKKPEFDEWLRDKRGYLLTKKLWQNGLLSKNPTDSTKAILGILEFTKAKPKQQIQVESATQLPELDADKLIEVGLELKGIGITAQELLALAGQKTV